MLKKLSKITSLYKLGDVAACAATSPNLHNDVILASVLT